MQRRSPRRSGRSREDAGAWQGVSLRARVLGLLRQRTIAQPLHPLAKVTQNLRRLASELSKPQARFTEPGIRNKISRWLTDSFVREVLQYGLEQRLDKWHLTFQVDNQALQQLWSQRLGRTVLL